MLPLLSRSFVPFFDLPSRNFKMGSPVDPLPNLRLTLAAGHRGSTTCNSHRTGAKSCAARLDF